MDGKREEKDNSISLAYVKNAPTIKITWMQHAKEFSAQWILFNFEDFPK